LQNWIKEILLEEKEATSRRGRAERIEGAHEEKE
jgi:hypothetical protein